MLSAGSFFSLHQSPQQQIDTIVSKIWKGMVTLLANLTLIGLRTVGFCSPGIFVGLLCA